MTDKKFELTRRRLLAGAGGIGAAAAGAGLGTSALFSDTESFENNSLQAGELSLRVTVDNIAYSTTIVRDNTVIEPDDAADGNTVTISVEDMKPGDWLILEWNLEVIGNPGYVKVTSVDEDYANAEGDNPEPETDTASPGDLGDAVLSTIWAGYPDTSGGTSRGDLVNLDPTTDLNDTGLSNYETPDQDGITSGGAHYTTMNEAHDVYKTGVLLRDPATGDPREVGAVGDGAKFFQLLELPPGVGNEIQGDQITFTLRFDAEQVRNNPTPFNSS